MKLAVQGGLLPPGSAVAVRGRGRVGELMGAIEDLHGVPACEQCLWHGGRRLPPAGRLVDHGVREGSTIRLALRLCGGAPKKKKGGAKKKGDDAGAGEITPEDIAQMGKLRIQFLERELMLKKEEATEAIHAKNELRERVKEFYDEFEREKLRTLDITADMTRQYKAMQAVQWCRLCSEQRGQERFILEINTLNNNIVDLQDQLRTSEKKLERHIEESKEQLQSKDAIIQEQAHKMEEMAAEFGKMLEDTLKKMTDRIEVGLAAGSLELGGQVSSKSYEDEEVEEEPAPGAVDPMA